MTPTTPRPSADEREPANLPCPFCGWALVPEKRLDPRMATGTYRTVFVHPVAQCVLTSIIVEDLAGWNRRAARAGEAAPTVGAGDLEKVCAMMESFLADETHDTEPYVRFGKAMLRWYRDFPKPRPPSSSPSSPPTDASKKTSVDLLLDADTLIRVMVSLISVEAEAGDFPPTKRGWMVKAKEYIKAREAGEPSQSWDSGKAANAMQALLVKIREVVGEDLEDQACNWIAKEIDQLFAAQPSEGAAK